MGDVPHASRHLRWTIGLVITIGLLYMSYVMVTPRGRSSIAPSVALPSDRTAVVSATDKRDYRFEVSVPEATPESFVSQREETVKQGEVIEFVVTSPRSGQVVVHGLLDPKTVDVNGRVTVSFRAIYTGRFALHFHGSDGSHFELMALNVLPAATVEHPQ